MIKYMKQIKLFENFKQSEEDQSSKIIYTVIPYFSNGTDVNLNDVKSFTDYNKAQEYTWTLYYGFEIVQNELI